VEELQSDEKIRIYTQAQVTEIDGYVGTTNPNKNVKRYR
jgi:heterodisulfide reductase subunit A-like polyferredoxin